MKVEVHGRMVYPIESFSCRTLVGKVRCTFYSDGTDCGKAGCVKPGQPSVAYLDDEGFTKYVAARLTS